MTYWRYRRASGHSRFVYAMMHYISHHCYLIIKTHNLNR